MAIAIADDIVVLNASDAITGWTATGQSSSEAVDANIKVEGTGSVSARVNGVGLGILNHDSGSANSRNLKDTHIFVWGNALQLADTKANGGWRIRISDISGGGTNFGEWIVGGDDTQVAPFTNFHRWAIDTRRGYDFTNGAVPTDRVVRSVAFVGNFLTSNGRISFFSDQMMTASGITITGTTSTSNGAATDAVVGDKSVGRGLFKLVGGIFSILGRITIGDVVALADSTFTDTNEVWVFEDQNVAGFFHQVEFVGGTGTNIVTFGTKVGAGITAVGVGGNVFKSAGIIPFRITATDSNINVNILGCSFVGPATKYDDALSSAQLEDVGTGFTDETVDANDVGAGDVSLIPATDAIGDLFYIGYPIIFSEVKFNISTIGTVGVVAWDYWDGTTWTALSDVADATTSYKTIGLNSVVFTRPTDWVVTTVNGVGPLFYIRSRITTTYTIVPLATQIFVSVGGRVEFEQINVECLSSTFTNMDVISIRNSAVIRGSTIASTLASVKEAALDLGAINPALDTVRDLTIQNNAVGILLKGTSIGTTTYDFRNLVFINNTTDVRIDFPAAATVVVNLLEGGTQTVTVDNVNTSTVTIVASPVTVKVNAKTTTGVNIQNVRVLITASDNTGAFPFEDVVTIVNNLLVATVAHTSHRMATGDKVKIKGASHTQNNSVFTITVTGANAYTYTLPSDPGSSPTGVIKATFVALEGLTDVNGDVSVSRVYGIAQPIIGTARKSTGAPFYKNAGIGGSVSPTNGLTVNVQMVLDQ